MAVFFAAAESSGAGEQGGELALGGGQGRLGLAQPGAAALRSGLAIRWVSSSGLAW